MNADLSCNSLLPPTVIEAVDYYSDDIISHPTGIGPIRLNVWRHGSYVELICDLNFRGELYPSQGEPGDAEPDYL